MPLTEREEKFIELNTTASALLGMTENQMGFSTDANTTYNIAEGTPIWRSNDNLHIGATQMSINATSGIATYAANKFGDTTFLGDINDGAPRNGFNGKQSDIASVFSFIFDENTRIATLSYTDNSDIDVFADGTRIIIPDGDARLTAAAIVTPIYGWYTYYIDTDGQLSWTTDSVETIFETKCLVMSVLYQPDNIGIPGDGGVYPRIGSTISQLIQHHGAESIDWREIHHSTDGAKIAMPLGFELSTTSTEETPTSVLTLSGGRLYDEDVTRAYSAVTASDPWVCYYYNGFTGSSVDVYRGEKTATNLTQIYVTAEEALSDVGNTNIIYSKLTKDVNGNITNAAATALEDGEYALAFVFIGMGPLANNVIVMGTEVYNSVEQIRDSIEEEIEDLLTSTTLLTETVMCGTVILNHEGNIIPINDNGLMVADTRKGTDNVTFGGTNEVCTPSGDGDIIASRSLSLSGYESSSYLKLSQLIKEDDSHVNNMLILGADGTVGEFDIFGAGSGSGTYTNIGYGTADNTITNGNETDTDDIGYLHSTTEDITSATLLYSLDVTIWSATGGLQVEVLKDGVVIDYFLYDGNWGANVILSRVISLGSIDSGTDFTIKAAPNKRWQSATINTATVTISGNTAAGAGNPYFVTAENGVGSGTHTFDSLACDDITIANDGAGSGIDADLLDGQHGSYYAINADVLKNNVATQTISANSNDLKIDLSAASITELTTTNILAVNTTGANDIYLKSGKNLRFGTNGSDDVMYLSTSGYLGLGTNIPTAKVSIVEGANTFNIDMSSFVSLESNALLAITSSTTKDIYVTSGNNLRLGSSGTSDRIFIATSGNVGIGTTSPSTELEINGELSYTSDPTWTQLGTSGVYYTKRGGIVFLKGTNNTTSIATLPVGYRPGATSNYHLSGAFNASISTAGVITIGSTSIPFAGVIFIAEN